MQDAVLSSSQAEIKREDETKEKKKSEETKTWAIPVNITSPCDDFYKRIPNPAFQVSGISFYDVTLPLVLSVA